MLGKNNVSCDNCKKKRKSLSYDYKFINHFCSKKCQGEYFHKLRYGLIKDKKLCELCQQVYEEEYGKR